MPQMPRLPELTIGPAARRGSVTVMPVFAATMMPRADYDLGTDAVRDGRLEIRELMRGATVAHLEARNRGARRVLLVEGDHLIGALQNRMVTSSVLIGGEQAIELPVSCVERGRWSGRSDQFASDGSSGSPRLRRIAKLTVTRSLFAGHRRAADQSQIWKQIADQQRSLRVTSATAALAHTYAARATDLASAASQLPYAAGAIGIALGVGAELVSVDLFDCPETCQRYWQRLVQGAALEGMAGARRPGGVTAGEIMRVLDELRAADWTRVPPVGDGDELRTTTASAGASLLVLDGRVVHFGVVHGSARGAALDSGVAVMRHDLPEPLARRFRVVGRLGVGGTKEVFRATDAQGGPDVAIARIPAVDRAQFAAEVALARRVQSEHVPKLIEAHIDEYGDGYLVMERCDGPSLAEIVGAGAMAIADAAPILVAFARGLCAIHQTAVLHRDVKLENVMLASSEAGPQLKILDFGLSERATDVTTAVISLLPTAGTLPYMAREVVRGAEVDARSDVFAFGVCCYRMLTGGFPLPPRDDESQLDYLGRLRDAVVDTSRLPDALPPAARAMIARMLDADRERRPFMPEVVSVFEQAFGAPPIAAAPRVQVSPRNAVLERAVALPIGVGRPERLLVSACDRAPLVILAPDDGTQTEVRAFGGDGRPRWTRRLDGCLVTGVRADLDRDGVREIYLAGPDRVAALDATGNLRFSRPRTRPTAHPSLIALPQLARPELALDGELVDLHTGALRGTLGSVYCGGGDRLVAATDARGLAYNGLALQGFRGDHATGAAILCRPGEPGFQVAHLEETRSGRVQIAVYGPGGARLHTLPIADCPVATGDVRAISRVYDRPTPLFGPQHAPIALLGTGGDAVVVVPLFEPAHGVPSALVAFGLPAGRELWRWQPGNLRGRALLADLAGGDGKPQIVVGTGRSLVVHDAWTGQASGPLPCDGLPVAFGDPFGTGFAHVITASTEQIELWRGPRCAAGTMAWTGARGDLWRTGTLGSDGLPLGPV